MSRIRFLTHTCDDCGQHPEDCICLVADDRPVDLEAIESALPDDGGSPYVCPLCSQRLQDIGGYWGCLCRGRKRRDGKEPAQ